MKPLCIYHKNCADGFGAAWVVNKAYDGDVELYGATHGDAPPDVRARTVIIVDFSYPRKVLLEMAMAAEKIVVLDHHKTAEADLVDLPSNVKTVFDMSRSGAIITWNSFAAGDPPTLLLHIQDRDLWRFEMYGTRAVSAALFSYAYELEVWDKLFATPIEELILEGTAIERKHFKDINELLPQVTRTMNIAGHKVPVANLPYIFSSDAGYILCKDKPFAACYMDTPTGRVFSLRSEKDFGLDVSEIAKLFGGGGHKNAAGFKVPHHQAAMFERTGESN